PGDQARYTLGGVDGALARQPHLLAEVLLPGRVVVVAPRPLLLLDRTVPRGEAGDDAVHHLVAVGQRELLRPPQLADVGPELVGALDQVREVVVGQRDPPALHRLLRDPDVVRGDLVADAPRTRVQEQPHVAPLVDGDLDEVVARPERPGLERPVAPGAAGAETPRLSPPPDSGPARSIAVRSAARSPVSSSRWYWVRTAAIPHPMSTPTAAGMIAPRVGIPEPTVAPLPRCASGISATCGKMNGRDAVASACARVLGSTMLAQFMSRLLTCCPLTTVGPAPLRGE